MSQLKGDINSPNPPALGTRIIQLMSRPDVEAAAIAAVISKDPGMTTKMLRAANSGFYAKRRKSENLRQAIDALGLNSAATMVLSLSFVDQFNKGKGTCIDYSLFWRRALLGAIVARGFSSLKAAGATEEVFLAALLQDIGILAIDRVQPSFYAGLPKHAGHADIVAYEMQAMQADHAALGAWLLRQWRLPEHLCAIIESSHAPLRSADTTLVGASARCLALGAECADFLSLEGSSEARLLDFAYRAVAWLGVGVDRIKTTLADVVQNIPEVEELFDLRLVGGDQHQGNTLDDRHRRDALTGVFNREHFEEVAQKEFHHAHAGRWPLSIARLDLDHFKAITDGHGRKAGDLVLQATARILVDVTRETDVLARYDGEAFIILLPGTTSAGAQVLCQRLLARLRAAEHRVGPTRIRATASLGLATHSVDTSFTSAADLMKAADICVCAAKEAGRNRLVIHDPGQP